MKKLVSMIDFSLEQVNKKLAFTGNSSVLSQSTALLNFRETQLIAIKNYANFLNQRLALWMFVPCDLEGNILEFSKSSWEEYDKAKERVLFEGWKMFGLDSVENKKINIHFTDFEHMTVEDLVKYDIILTES